MHTGKSVPASQGIGAPFAPQSAAHAAGIEPQLELQQQVVKKISKRLLGFLFTLFVFSFLDRINIGFAGLTMGHELGLTATQFGFATTVFYIAYVLCGMPSNLIQARVGARRWMTIIMIAWGLASTATMFAHDARSLYIFRIVVGITEAGFLPGMLLYLTYWFPAVYRARANTLFMIAMPVTTALGSVVSGYILGLDGVRGLAGWQWLFLLEGLPSVCLGFAVWFYLDDSPAKAKWLSAPEKDCLAAMFAAEQRESAAKLAAAEVKRPSSMLREIFSPVILKIALAYFLLVNTLSMVNIWVPQIIKSFNAGSSNASIGLLTAIPQLCTIAGMIYWGVRSDRKQERKWHIALPMLFAAAGWLTTALAADPLLRLLGLCMASTGAFAAMAIFWTAPDSLLSYGARPLGIAFINATGNIGSALNAVLIGFLVDLSHSFTSGLLFAVTVLVLGALLVLTLPIVSAKKAATV
jgi:ACS family 4-hydroxyphenylacetate permease-like MFS transporter